MSDSPYDWEEEEDGENAGLVFGKGIFARSNVAVEEDTSEVMSYLVPEYGISVSAFLVDDFEMANDLGVDIIPGPQKGNAFIRIDRNLWDFIEDVSGCEHETYLYQGLILGQLLVGTAHRIFFNQTGYLPNY